MSLKIASYCIVHLWDNYACENDGLWFRINNKHSECACNVKLCPTDKTLIRNC